MDRNQVKVQKTVRRDGQITVTIKLIGWDLNMLRGLVANLTMTAFGKTLSTALNDAIERPKGS